MSRYSSQTVLLCYLARHGMTDSSVVQEIQAGFDTRRPIYERLFEPGEVLYQLMRLSSFRSPSPNRGDWFGLAGITPNSVAVLHGLAGRSTHKFRGTAAGLGRDWGKEIGGPGGGTQVFVPRALAGFIVPIGPVKSW